MSAADADAGFPLGWYCEIDTDAITAFMAVELALRVLHTQTARCAGLLTGGDGSRFADAVTDPLRARLLHQSPAPR